jgi:UDP-glucose 4-epimerase
MKVLVTGGTGFVGANLLRALKMSEISHELTSLDSYISGKAERELDGCVYHNGNCRDISEIFGSEKFDLIFHLGEYSRVESSFSRPDEIIEGNLAGTASVIAYAVRNKCKLVYSCSSTKFAEYDEKSTASPYAISKIHNAEMVKMAGKYFGLDYVITYFYNAYGKDENKFGEFATLIGIFSDLASKNVPLPVVLPGTQKRYFTHIDDIVSGLILAGFNGSGDGYGIGYDKAYSVKEVAEMFGKPIEYLPERNGNRLDSDLITTKTKALGWEPKQDIKDYINSLY